MIKYANIHDTKNGEIKIDEKTLLDNLDGITVTGLLVSKLPHGVTVYWEYLRIINDGYGPAYAHAHSREEAECISYHFNPFDDKIKRIRLNPKNDNHVNISKANELLSGWRQQY